MSGFCGSGPRLRLPNAVLSPGDFVGEMAMLTGEQRSATVTALTPVETLVCNASEFGALVQTAPSVKEKVIATAGSSNRSVPASRAPGTRARHRVRRTGRVEAAPHRAGDTQRFVNVHSGTYQYRNEAVPRFHPTRIHQNALCSPGLSSGIRALARIRALRSGWPRAVAAPEGVRIGPSGLPDECLLSCDDSPNIGRLPTVDGVLAVEVEDWSVQLEEQLQAVGDSASEDRGAGAQSQRRLRLTGNLRTEATNASTTGLVDATTGDWSSGSDSTSSAP